MLMATGKDRVHRADEITQVIGSSEQAGAGQVDLAFTEQMRHLRSQGKRPMPMAIIRATKLASKRISGDMFRFPAKKRMPCRLRRIDFL